MAKLRQLATMPKIDRQSAKIFPGWRSQESREPGRPSHVSDLYAMAKQALTNSAAEVDLQYAVHSELLRSS